MQALCVENVSFSYHTEWVLSQVNCVIQQGECAFIIGPNGAGKTTLFSLISGLMRSHEGKIEIHGKSITAMNGGERARTVSVVEQDGAYVFPFTVEEVVLMGRYAHGARMFETKEDKEKAAWALAATHTEQFRHRSIRSLSGGERRRVEIARALAQEAPLMLLDEPTSHLDIKQQRELFEMLFRLYREEKKTLCIITHDIALVRNYATSVFFMKQGRLTKVLDTTILADEDALIRMY